jgi:hypothetical protein
MQTLEMVLETVLEAVLAISQSQRQLLKSS